jgi:hypothetical protein
MRCRSDDGVMVVRPLRDYGEKRRLTVRADEIAAMAMFLFSDSANWITGQVFVRHSPASASYIRSLLALPVPCPSNRYFAPAGRRRRREPRPGTAVAVPAGGTRPEEHDGSDSGQDLGGLKRRDLFGFMAGKKGSELVS